MAKLGLLPNMVDHLVGSMRTVETAGNCEVHSPGYCQGTATNAAVLVPVNPLLGEELALSLAAQPTLVLLPPPHSLGLSTPVVTPTDHLRDGLLIFSHDFPGRKAKGHSAIVTG